MLRIKCPWCGVRDQTDFQFGGESHIARPETPEHASDAEWANYLYFRKNPKGLHYERWVHSYGCRQWFNIARDTLTHEIIEVYKMGEQPSTRSDTGKANKK